LSPFVFAGLVLERIRYSRIDILKFNAGLEYLVSSENRIKAFAEQNINFSDTTIDYLERGVR
jgi:hypothetical protein